MSEKKTYTSNLIVKKTGKGEIQYYVNVTRSKGVKEERVQNSMIGFNAVDAADGIEVLIEEENGIIKKVTVPGKAEKPLETYKKDESKKSGGGKQGQGNSRRGGQERTPTPSSGVASPVSRNRQDQAPASVLGMPFYNPYTFLPFAEPKTTLERKPFTPLTVDERETGRFTGIIELDIETLSPLLSSAGMCDEEIAIRCAPNKSREDKARAIKEIGHKTYKAMKIDADVIVPATGIRGALRNLMTLLTAGPPATIDTGMFLCQGRNLQLGAGKDGTRVFLARVVSPGDYKKSGIIELGETCLVDVNDIVRFERNLPRPTAGGKEIVQLWADLEPTGFRNNQPQLRAVRSIQRNPNSAHAWCLKLSGQPVPGKKKKSGAAADKFEGAFRGKGKDAEIELPKQLWAEYMFRHRHGVRKSLKKGDLIWLQPNDGVTVIERADQIKSIQWARWGREGIPVKDAVPPKVYPDCFRSDNLVSPVTDLFGQVPVKQEGVDVHGNAFAGRICPENLVFENAAKTLQGPFPLAVMSSPHPGCMAFYRNDDNPKTVSSDAGLRGYKVYRNSTEAGIADPKAPWRFETQGIYDPSGRLESKVSQNANISVQLLPEGNKGRLRLAVRSLSEEELALLLLACNATWRLGGGKPLGLGHCQAKVLGLLNEFGENVPIQEFSDTALLRLAKERLVLWEKMQLPVENLRYPRGVTRTQGKDKKSKNTRGGHAWFSKFSKPKPDPQNENKQVGMTTLEVCGPLDEKLRHETGIDTRLISGQTLKRFDPDDPKADLLYGYDAFFCDTEEREPPFDELKRDGNKRYPKIVPFDEDKFRTGNETSQENRGQNAQTRHDERSRR